jgi:acetylornithine deacetylase/succinyl-diaminopimelate desuccinylase-like protein
MALPCKMIWTATRIHRVRLNLIQHERVTRGVRVPSDGVLLGVIEHGRSDKVDEAPIAIPGEPSHAVECRVQDHLRTEEVTNVVQRHLREAPRDISNGKRRLDQNGGHLGRWHPLLGLG